MFAEEAPLISKNIPSSDSTRLRLVVLFLFLFLFFSFFFKSGRFLALKSQTFAGEDGGVSSGTETQMCRRLFFTPLFRILRRKEKKKAHLHCKLFESACASLCVRANVCVCCSFLSPSLSFSLFEMQHLQMCLVNCSSQLLPRSEGESLEQSN